jgi:hypothetical protein
MTTLLRRLGGLVVCSLATSCLSLGGAPSWPTPAPARISARSSATDVSDDDIVRSLPVCVAARSWSAGDLGRSVLYHYRRDGRTLRVGYFVYWTTERPWGDNALSYSLVPALFIDAFYSHFLFLFPGAQRIIHGPGDIEGARVTYELRDDGTWAPVSAVADDGEHHEVPLTPEDFVDAEGRVVLMTDVWSHQLGAKGARVSLERRRGSVVCFDRDSIEPLTDAIARDFRLGSPADPRRAPPAWKLGASVQRVAAVAAGKL